MVGEERIETSFFADGGGLTVARIDDRPVFQSEKLLPQGAKDGFLRSAPKVGTSYAAVKQRVARKQLPAAFQ